MILQKQWLFPFPQKEKKMLELQNIAKDTVDIKIKKETFEVDFKERVLPENAININEAPKHIQDYAKSRSLPLDKLLWANNKPVQMYNRIIVPFTWKGKTIGFTARSTDDTAKPKYFTNHDTGYVFGIDNQHPNARLTVVTEGILDALSIGGVAILSNNCSDTQAQIIDTLGNEIVLVPDRDASGQKLIDDALEYGWSVSFPEWEDDIKDVNDAVVRYGKLFTLKSIIDAKQTNRLKINLLRKKW